jgi:hypothetical protein
MPAAWGNWVPITDDWVNTRRSGSDQWLGSWRPPDIGSVLLGEDPEEDVEGVNPQARPTPMSR